MGSMSCLDPLAFLFVSPKRVNPCIHSLAAALLPRQGTVRDLNRVHFSILLRNIPGAKLRYVVSLALKPNQPVNNWRLHISDTEVTST